MKDNMVNWFEIPVNDMDRAKKFYTAVFGRELTDVTMPHMTLAMFPWVQGAPHAAGALVKADGLTPSATATTVYFMCEDVANELSRVEAAGGKVVAPKFNLGEWGFAAYAMDTEGNRFGLHSEK